ncbi:MAG: glycosyl hydrolase family 65 protein [Actinomycetota bacterium]
MHGSTEPTPLGARARLPLPDRRFEALVFDWDGTAVPDRQADASEVRERIEALCRAGVDVFIVSGTHVGNVDGQLRARPTGPGRLFLCLNRGSEVFRVEDGDPVLVWRRTATPDENAALDRAAARAVEELARHGLEARIVSERLNRRKIDIIPLPEWDDPPKARIDELLDAVMKRVHRSGFTGIADVVSLVMETARAAEVSDPRVTSDVKHVEIGLTDKSDSAKWALDELASRGVSSGLVLIAGDEFGPIGGATGSDSLMLVPEAARATVCSVGVEPNGVPEGVQHLGGGPAFFNALLDDQLARRRDGRAPDIDPDPAWTLTLGKKEPWFRRVNESLLTISDGRFGTRGAREEDGDGTDPLLLASGVFERTDDTWVLLAGPLWSNLLVHQEPQTPDVFTLDMATGLVLRERGDGEHRLRTARFASATCAGVMALRAEGHPDEVATGPTLEPPIAHDGLEQGKDGRIAWARTISNLGGGITVAAVTAEKLTDDRRVIERLCGATANPHHVPEPSAAIEIVERARAVGFDRLLADHRAEWATRWRDAAISIDGDPDTEKAVRFALFHLIQATPSEDEASIGARGVSGPAYGGHVFWDTDVFVLPVLAATRPEAARAMLEYRIRRLPAAREAAKRRRLQGARFPWESADDGYDVSPRFARTPEGIVPIRTGTSEEHIVADVAWAAVHYARWTGDDEFLRGPGRALVIDTARYWASKMRFDNRGRAHIYGVIGPDEYHEIVDDNAFTNVMARWNLRQAAQLTEHDGSPADAEYWRGIAHALVDGYDERSKIYEQFSGFRKLEPLIIAEMADRPVAADVLLGRRRVADSQVIKQADVLMLHHLVPEEVAPDSLAANVDFYEPRTAHGSSLSPAIHAALLARTGETERALELLRLACRLDLADLTGTTASGLHMATLGGIWQAIVFGFLGMRTLEGGGFSIDAHLPAAWKALEVNMRIQGRHVRVRAQDEAIEIVTDQPIDVSVAGGPNEHVVGSVSFDRRANGWKRVST